MSILSSANVTDVNLVLKERTHMRLWINMLIFTHNLGNWLISNTCSMNFATMMTMTMVMSQWYCDAHVEFCYAFKF